MAIIFAVKPKKFTQVSSMNGAYVADRLLDCFRVENKTLYRTFLATHGRKLLLYGYYGATIFASVGISDSFVTQIILGSVNFVCTFDGLYVMEKVASSHPYLRF
jgi:SP family sugar:H+ symporter-like MFS transporter